MVLLSLWSSLWAWSCRWAVSLTLGGISGAVFFQRHRQALPDSTESSSSWNKVFPINILVYKLFFFFESNAQHLSFGTVCETDDFFMWSINLFNFCIYYSCFWKHLSIPVQTNLCPSSLQFLFLQSEELLLFWVEPASFLISAQSWNPSSVPGVRTTELQPGGISRAAFLDWCLMHSGFSTGDICLQVKQ